MTRVLAYTLDRDLQSVLAPPLGREYHLVTHSDRDEFKRVASEGQWDVVLIDLDSSRMSMESVICLFDEIAAAGLSVVMMGDDEARSQALDLVQRGAHAYCRKPPAIRELKACLCGAREVTDMKRKLAGQSAAPASFDDLIGRSPSMLAVFDLIRRVTNVNASVLVTGPSGTGKELIARAIHKKGHRHRSPFIPVSCGAIPETLIESELFGHEKGAFTGTVGQRIGYFEQAGDGSLFLDEIGELSPLTQVKLLRVLQEREFCRLGSSRMIPLRARVILATHRNLKEMVGEGKFRLDLYYRINVMTIEAPPLAEHPEDIHVLADHFVKRYSGAYNKKVERISKKAMQVLESYDWPGNVRELENVIQGSIIRTDTEVIDVVDLPEQLQESDVPEECAANGTFDRMLRDYKFKLAMRALEDCKGNKTMASRTLDISRAYLHRLLKLNGREELGIESDLSETA